MRDELINRLKKHEGFSGLPYTDTTGNPTIGYGIKLPLTRDEAEFLLKHRLYKKRNELINKWNEFLSLPGSVQSIVLEMCYQLGVNGFLTFQRTIKYLEDRQWKGASTEMLDSKWAIQTPNRSKELSDLLAKVRR